MQKILRIKLIFVIVFTLLVAEPNFTFAHPGRTDSSGCHTCRTNCARWGLSTGEYHCHRSKGVPQPLEPIKSHRAPTETGTGFTTPAPEYKEPKQTVKAEPMREVSIPVKQKQETKVSLLKRLFKALGF